MLPSLTTVAMWDGIVRDSLLLWRRVRHHCPRLPRITFGSRNVGPIYGLMATAWGVAAAFGPLLLAATLKSSGGYRSGLHSIAVIMSITAFLPVIISPPRPKSVWGSL